MKDGRDRRAEAGPGEVYSPEPSVLERRAAGWIISEVPATAEGIADAGARAVALRRATRRAVALAVGAGIVSGGIIGGSEVWIRQVLFGGTDPDWREVWEVWAVWFAAIGVVSAVEIGYLYLVALKGVARIVAAGGTPVGDEGYPGLVGRGLARGALEFPNPRVTVFGVDPYAYVPGWRLTLKALAYKMKVGVSSFVLRVFLRRVAARLAIRGFVPLVAGPLYAAWNAWIVWKIMEEARLRVLGPPAIDAVLEGLDLGPANGEALMHGVGEVVMRGADAHPNAVYLLARLREALGVEEELAVDWPAERDGLAALAEADRDRVLAAMALAALVGSRMRRAQRRTLAEAAEAAGRRLDEGALKALRRRFRAGEVPGTEEVAAVVGGRPS